MKITQVQLSQMHELRLQDFLARLVADLHQKGFAVTEDVARRRIEEAIELQLHEEESVQIYAECYLRLERAHFDLLKLRKIAGADDLDRDHKLVAMKMLVDRVENPTGGGRNV